MATESVKILIEAEDQASAKIAAATKAVEANVKRIKDVGGQAKKSTDFIGQLAGTLGNSEVASFAGQIGGLTEKVSQFSEVSKAGGAGAMLFKAGLVAAAGAIGFQIGQALGNVIFQTEKWNKEIEKATQRSRELISELAKANDLRFQDNKADIELIRNPEEKKAAYEDMLKSLKTNIIGVEKQMRSSEKAAKEWEEAWKITGNRKEYAKQAEQQAKDDRERLKSLQSQAKEIERIIGIEAERAAKQKENQEKDASEAYVASLREQLALEKAIGDEKIELEAKKVARGDDVAVATELLKQIEAEKQAKENLRKEEEQRLKLLEDEKRKQEELEKQREAERKKAADDEFNAIMRLEEKTLSLNQALELRQIALEKGAEAARRQALEFEGLDAADAARIAAKEQELQLLEEQKQKEARDREKQLEEQQKQSVSKAPAASGPLQASQSRTLLRGSGEGFQVKIADSTKKAAVILEDVRKLQADLLEVAKQNKPVAIKLEQR